MKKRVSQIGKLVLLAALVAVSPSLARASYHTGCHAAHCVKTAPCAKFFPQAGLRAGRLTFLSRGIAKRNLEDLDSAPRVFVEKVPLAFGKQPKPFVSTTAFPPRNFRVLRI